MFVFICVTYMCYVKVYVMKSALWLRIVDWFFLWHSWPVTGFEHTFLKIASATAIPTTQGKKQSRT